MTTSTSAIASGHPAAPAQAQAPLLHSRCAAARKIREEQPRGQVHPDQRGTIGLEFRIFGARTGAGVIVVYANQLSDVREPQPTIAVAGDVEGVIRPQPVACGEAARFEGPARTDDRLLTDVREHDLVRAEGAVVDSPAPRHVDVAIVDG